MGFPLSTAYELDDPVHVAAHPSQLTKARFEALDEARDRRVEPFGQLAELRRDGPRECGNSIAGLAYVTVEPERAARTPSRQRLGDIRARLSRFAECDRFYEPLSR